MIARITSNRRLLLGAVAVIVLVAAGTTAARAMTSGDGAPYRTAVAAMGTVDQELTGVGTVSAVNRVSVAFPVSGTVATVPVSVGTKVSAGQVLARLSPTQLDQALNTANSDLASARQTLATDQASETGSTATESAAVSESADSFGATVLASATDVGEPETAVVLTAAVSPRPSGGSSGAASTGNLTQSIAQVTAAQKAVIAAQQKLDVDLTAAESALATCQTALSATSGPGSTPPSSAPPTSTPAASTPTTSTPAMSTSAGATAAAGPDDGSATCLAAIAGAPSKANAAKDQQARDQAERQLDTTISQLEAAAKKAASSSGSSSGTGTGRTGGTGSSGNSGGTGTANGGARTTGSTRTGTGSTGTGGTGSTGSTGSNSNYSGTGSGSGASSTGSTSRSSGPASAAQLAADQAQIDAAQAQLVVAQQNLAAATLTSPVAGTVASVSISAGKAAGSSSTITVIGTGQSQVSTTVGLADIDKVKVGDKATVKVDGISSALTGRVSLIGILNTSSGSSTSYPVTILLDPTSQKLYDGSGASTQIEIAQVSNVLTVPSSTVRSVGQFSTVTVLNNGKPVPTRVTIGAVGTDRTQILAGLKAGQSVVLANLNQKLPTSSS